MKKITHNVVVKGIQEYSGSILRNIYDPKTRKIFNRTPVDFVFACLFYMIFYGFLFGITYICYLSARLFSVDQRKHIGPSTTTVISKYPALIPIPNSIISSYDCNDPKTYEERKNQLKSILENYNTKYFKTKCLYGGNNAGSCYFDTQMLGDCNHEPYGLDTDRPCLFFRIAKIFEFNPLGIGNNTDFIPVHCYTNDKTQTVEIIPREGLLKDALPFNGHNMPPIVALRTKINNKEPVDVWCVIRAEGIDVPTKYRQENMFGTVKFELGPSLNSKHCSS